MSYLPVIKDKNYIRKFLKQPEWLLANVDQEIGWPEKKTVVVFRNIEILLFPQTKVFYPAAAIRLQSNNQLSSAKILLMNFFSSLSWVYNGGIRIIHWTTPTTINHCLSDCLNYLRIKRNVTSFGNVIHMHFRPTYLPDPQEEMAKLALALYREGLTLNNEAYSFLSFFKIINLKYRHGNGQQKWIKNNINALATKTRLLKETIQKRINEIILSPINCTKWSYNLTSKDISQLKTGILTGHTIIKNKNNYYYGTPENIYNKVLLQNNLYDHLVFPNENSPSQEIDQAHITQGMLNDINSVVLAHYLYVSCRCAIAHAGTDPIYNPENPEDEIRLHKDKPLIMNLAKLIIENEFGVKSDFTIHKEHLYELDGFSKTLNKDTLIHLKAGHSLPRRSVIIADKISIRLWAHNKYKALENLTTKVIHAYDGIVELRLTDRSNTVSLTIFLNFPKEKLVIEPFEPHLTIHDNGTSESALAIASLQKFLYDYLSNGVLEIWHPEKNEILGRLDEYIPVNIMSCDGLLVEEKKWKQEAAKRKKSSLKEQVTHAN